MARSHLATANAAFVYINQKSDSSSQNPVCRYAMALNGLPAIHSLTEELADEKDIRPGGGYRDPVVGFGM